MQGCLLPGGAPLTCQIWTTFDLAGLTSGLQASLPLIPSIMEGSKTVVALLRATNAAGHYTETVSATGAYVLQEPPQFRALSVEGFDSASNVQCALRQTASIAVAWQFTPPRPESAPIAYHLEVFSVYQVPLHPDPPRPSPVHPHPAPLHPTPPHPTSPHPTSPHPTSPHPTPPPLHPEDVETSIKQHATSESAISIWNVSSSHQDLLFTITAVDPSGLRLANS